LSITVSAAVQQWLGDVMTVQSVDVTSAGSELQVALSYLVTATGTAAATTVSIPVG